MRCEVFSVGRTMGRYTCEIDHDPSNPAPPPVVLDYRPGVPDASAVRPFDRVVLFAMALVCGVVVVGLIAITVDLWIESWPSFGMTLVAVPAGIVASAFGYVAFTAARVAVSS